MADNQQLDLHAMRHSLAHIMATAITRLYPGVKLGVGPVVENGFYYDIDLGYQKQISDEDFEAIETEMKKIIAENVPFERFTSPVDEAIAWAKESGQPYKEELLNDLKRAGTTSAKDLDPSQLGVASSGDSQVAEVSFYRNGDFTDLCRGPHIEATSKAGAFKLMRVSGAYWRGKEENPQMQRVYGVGFATDKELRQYLNMLEEAKKRDHRKLGQDLDLFTFSPLVGAGLPLWTPRGTVVRTELDRFVQELRDEAGFQQVTIPHITKKDLYEKSGHWAKFKDELFKITTRDGHEYAMKPMNCPHHTQIYDSKPRSYRELPIRYRDTTMVYRDEQSGELGGLSRVLSITQDDAHIFCRLSQAKAEALSLWDIIERFYSTVGIELKLRLSLHDPENQDAYMGSEDKWQEVENGLRDIARERVGDDFIEAVGDAAFYGPKLDFLGRDALGREHQVATVQIDFGQPEGFDLTCTNEEGEDERIVMVHCAVMGSLERFLSVYIEHTAGRFPVWTAPEQVRIITVNQEESTVVFAAGVVEQARKLGLRAYVDNDNQSVGKKIRSAELMKVPYTLVLGQKEVETGEVSPRVRKDMEVSEEHQPRTLDEFLKTVAHEAKSRVNKTSL
ncbi:MAG TPA: threonine--tRNA ligase [Candidatus Saccharimonadales bacterium]|nr:threonine--tRNA ligase [Candidatus Saccharimonadales bacterium]